MRLSLRLLLIVGFVAMNPLLLAPIAIAEDDDVDRRGPCSGSSRWELDLSREHRGIEIDFEVDQNVVGERWSVVLRHDGDVFFRDVRTTHGDDGSFDVERHTDDATGTDRFVGKAVNRSTDEVCKGAASI